VDLESLCIEPGKSAFVLYLDLVCLNYDGGVLDAAVLACVGALNSRTSYSILACLSNQFGLISDRIDRSDTPSSDFRCRYERNYLWSHLFRNTRSTPRTLFRTLCSLLRLFQRV